MQFDIAKVTFVVPAYNAEKYIYKCIKSIAQQTYSNIEIIVIDDGSLDNTLSIVNDLAGRDSRIKVISQKNCGVSTARNRGISESTGDYIVFVDADDYISTDYADYMMNIANKTKANFCLSTQCFTKKCEQQLANLTVKSLSSGEAAALLLSCKVIVGCWNKMFKKSFLLENKIFFSTNLFYGEGLNFIITAALLSNCVGVGNKKVYYYRRNNEMSATAQVDVNKIKNGEKSLLNIQQKISTSDDGQQAMLNLHFATFYLGAVVKLKCFKKQSNVDYKNYKQKLRQYTRRVILKFNVPVYRKAMLLGGCVLPGAVAKLDVRRKAKIVENSIEN